MSANPVRSGIHPDIHRDATSNGAKISVIIPIYNSGKSLYACLQSVFANSYKDFEVIVVDDVSTDLSSKIAEKFPCKIIHLTENRGPAYARQAGLGAASGEIIAYTDSDCIVPSDWLEKIHAKLTTDIIGIGGKYILPAHLNPISKLFITYWDIKNVLFKKPRKSISLYGGNGAFWKEVLLRSRKKQEVFYCNKKVGGDDTLLCYELGKFGTIIYDPDISVIHDKNISFKKVLKETITLGYSGSMVAARCGMQLLKEPQRLYKTFLNLFSIALTGFTLLLPFLPSLTSIYLLTLGAYAISLLPLMYFVHISVIKSPAIFLMPIITWTADILHFVGLCKKVKDSISEAIINLYRNIRFAVNILNHKALSRIILFVTTRCNASCEFCFNKNSEYTVSAQLQSGKTFSACSDFFCGHGVIDMSGHVDDEQKNLSSAGPDFISGTSGAENVLPDCSIYCQNHETERLQHTAGDELSLNEIEKIAKNIPYLPWLTISGGEPFLRKDLSSICTIFYKNCRTSKITIVTNGSLPEMIETTVEKIMLDTRGLHLSVAVALDHINEKHDRIKGLDGCYKKATETIKKLNHLKYRFPKRITIGINTILNKENSEDIMEVAEHISNNLAYDYHVFNPLRIAPRTPASAGVINNEIYDKLIKTTNKKLMPKTPRFMKKSFHQAFLEECCNTTMRAHNGGYKSRTFQKGFKSRVKNLFHPISSQQPTEFLEKMRDEPCKAINKFLVINNNGDVSACELIQEPLGNLRENNYDIHTIRKNPSSRNMQKNITKTRCYCQWPCAVTSNTLFNFRSHLRILKNVMVNKK